jgi:hypoxanthine phosphoribosyltransferase
LVNEIKKLRRNNGTSVQLSLEFIRVKSYTNESSGGVKISLTDAELEEFKGKVKRKKKVFLGGKKRIVC